MFRKSEKNFESIFSTNESDSENRSLLNQSLIGLGLVLFILALIAVIASGCFCFGASVPLLIPICQSFMMCCAYVGVSSASVALPIFITTTSIAVVSLATAILEAVKPNAILQAMHSFAQLLKNCTSKPPQSKKAPTTIQQQKTLQKNPEQDKKSNKNSDVQKKSSANNTDTEKKLSPEIELKNKHRILKQQSAQNLTALSQSQLIVSQSGLYENKQNEKDKFEKMNKEREELDEKIKDIIITHFTKSSKEHASWIRFISEMSPPNPCKFPEDAEIFFKRFNNELKQHSDLAKLVTDYQKYSQDKQYNTYLKEKNCDSHIDQTDRRSTMTKQNTKADVFNKKYGSFNP